jgi:hypothetical protein
VRMPLQRSSPDETLDEDEELEEHASLVTGVKLLMSVHQVTAADIAAKVDCPKTDITAWLNGGMSPRVERQCDRVMWELQCEQPPWWASRPNGRCLWKPAAALPAAPAGEMIELMEVDCPGTPDEWSTQCDTRAVSSATQCSTRAVSGATRLSDLVMSVCPDGEANICDAYGVAGMSDESHERLYVSADVVADHPPCANGHPMITTDYAGPGYVSGYVCDECTGRSSEGHLEWTRERWHCGECTYDVCFQCIPQRWT